MVYPANGSNVLVKDIFRRVGVAKFAKNRANLIGYYIQDGETPDIVANNIYGASQYHWIILLMNDIVNVNEDWPIQGNDIMTLVTHKYGENNGSDVHHYCLTEDTSIVVDYTAEAWAAQSIQAVSNTQYEIDVNDAKRDILVLRTEFLQEFVSQYKKLIVK